MNDNLLFHTLVPYNIAKLVKEHGFNGRVVYYYYNGELMRGSGTYTKSYNNLDNYISVPYYYQIFEWLNVDVNNVKICDSDDITHYKQLENILLKLINGEAVS